MGVKSLLSYLRIILPEIEIAKLINIWFVPIYLISADIKLPAVSNIHTIGSVENVWVIVTLV